MTEKNRVTFQIDRAYTAYADRDVPVDTDSTPSSLRAMAEHVARQMESEAESSDGLGPFKIDPHSGSELFIHRSTLLKQDGSQQSFLNNLAVEQCDSYIGFRDRMSVAQMSRGESSEAQLMLDLMSSIRMSKPDAHEVFHDSLFMECAHQALQDTKSKINTIIKDNDGKMLNQSTVITVTKPNGDIENQRLNGPVLLIDSDNPFVCWRPMRNVYTGMQVLVKLGVASMDDTIVCVHQDGRCETFDELSNFKEYRLNLPLTNRDSSDIMDNIGHFVRDMRQQEKLNESGPTHSGRPPVIVPRSGW